MDNTIKLTAANDTLKVSQATPNGDITVKSSGEAYIINNDDFTNLLSYYKHIKRNNIYNAYINPKGEEPHTTQMEFEEECNKRVKSIAEELEQIVDGECKLCPECGKYEYMEYDEDTDRYYCDNCESWHDSDDCNEQATVYDYLADALDYDITISSTGDYRGVSACVGFGGPNIYIDTNTGNVELYWGTTKAFWSLSYSVIDAINDYFEEFWKCMR